MPVWVGTTIGYTDVEIASATYFKTNDNGELILYSGNMLNSKPEEAARTKEVTRFARGAWHQALYT